MDTALCDGIGTLSEKLGSSFISPQQISAMFGCEYTPDQMRQLEAEARKIAVESKLPDDILVLPPLPKRVNLYAILLMSGSSGVHRQEPYQYVRTTEVRMGRWFVLPRVPAIATFRLVYWKQQALVPPGHQVMNAAEIAYVVAAFKRIHGVELFEGQYLRSDTVYVPDFNVAVGGRGGEVSILVVPNNQSLENFGMAWAQFR